MGFCRFLCIGAGAVIVSGCALAGALNSAAEPPPQTYDLHAPEISAGASVRSGLQILVLPPSAIKVLDTQNIVVRPSPDVIAHLDDAQWADTLPRLFQARLMQTLQSGARLRAIGQAGEGLRIDYRLAITIRAFDVAAYAPAHASAVVFATLIDDTNGVTRASRLFRARVDLAQGHAPPAAIAGLNAAGGEILGDIAEWIGAVLVGGAGASAGL